MNTLYVLRGLPASGKSTWAKAMVKDQEFRAIRINRDDMRQMMHDGVHSVEREFFIAQSEQSLAAQGLMLGYDVIIDDTNLKMYQLRPYRNVAEVCNKPIQLVIFDLPSWECIERDARRSKPVGREVIERMAIETEPLDGMWSSIPSSIVRLTSTVKG
jgi:Predicted kinase